VDIEWNLEAEHRIMRQSSDFWRADDIIKTERNFVGEERTWKETPEQISSE
jgi:hypothetical protein